MRRKPLVVVYERTLKQVRDSLHKSRGRWPVISRETGIPYHTMTKIAQGTIENPSVYPLQTLSDYFHEQRAA